MKSQTSARYLGDVCVSLFLQALVDYMKFKAEMLSRHPVTGEPRENKAAKMVKSWTKAVDKRLRSFPQWAGRR